MLERMPAWMGKTLSIDLIDLRSRVIAAVEGGLSCHAAAAQFQIGIATAVRWVSVFRQTGANGPKPKGGDTRSHSHRGPSCDDPERD